MPTFWFVSCSGYDRVSVCCRYCVVPCAFVITCAVLFACFGSRERAWACKNFSADRTFEKAEATDVRDA